MTKRDFQALAAGLYEAKIQHRERLKLANVIAAVCIRNNKEFDSKKFYEAAGVNNVSQTKESSDD